MSKNSLIKAFYTGLALGLFFVHLDLFTRDFSRGLEWFEPHLSALAAVPFFVLLALLVELFSATVLSRVKRDDLLGLFSCSLSIALFVSSLSVLLEEYAQRIVPNELLFLLLVIIVFDFTRAIRLGKGLSYALLGFIRGSTLRRVCNSYLLFVSVSLVFSLALDLSGIYRKQSSPIGKESATRAANVFLFVLDTVRADVFAETLQELPKESLMRQLSNQATLYTNANSGSPWTLPAHASLFTGKYVFEHGVTLRHQYLPEDALTLAEKLNTLGYHSAGFTANVYLKSKFGFDQGFSHYSDRVDFYEWKFSSERFSIRRFIDWLSADLHQFLFRADGEKIAAEIRGEIEGWLEQGIRKPFFLFANFYDAHDPYDPPKPFRSSSLDAKSLHRLFRKLTDWKSQYEVKTVGGDISTTALAGLKELYAAEIRYLLSEIDLLLEYLEQRKLLDNSIIIFTSDHGEEFLEHGGMGHAATLYEESLRVPLIIFDPRDRKLKESDQRIFLRDLHHMILALADGKSLSDIEPTRLELAELYGREQWSEPEQVRSLYHENLKMTELHPTKTRLQSGLFEIENYSSEREVHLNQEEALELRLQQKLRDLPSPEKGSSAPN